MAHDRIRRPSNHPHKFLLLLWLSHMIVDVRSKMDLDSNEFEDLPPVPLSGGDNDDSSNKTFLSEVTNSGIPAFPWRLHDMLNAAEVQSYQHMVSWQNGGKAFKVHDPKVFVQSIMPKYFNQTQYKSFQRQLNIYGFRRILHGGNKGAYTHDLFVRGNASLCRFMVRTKIKNKSSKEPPAGGLVQNRSCPDSLRDLQRALQRTQDNQDIFSRPTMASSMAARPQRKRSISLSAMFDAPYQQQPQQADSRFGGGNQPWSVPSSIPMLSCSRDIAAMLQNIGTVSSSGTEQIVDTQNRPSELDVEDCLEDFEASLLGSTEPLTDLTDDFFSNEPLVGLTDDYFSTIRPFQTPRVSHPSMMVVKPGLSCPHSRRDSMRPLGLEDTIDVTMAPEEAGEIARMLG
jgi:hypothetical protein